MSSLVEGMETTHVQKCYRSLHLKILLLSSCFLFKNPKTKIYKNIILLVSNPKGRIQIEE